MQSGSRRNSSDDEVTIGNESQEKINPPNPGDEQNKKKKLVGAGALTDDESSYHESQEDLGIGDGDPPPPKPPKLKIIDSARIDLDTKHKYLEDNEHVFIFSGTLEDSGKGQALCTKKGGGGGLGSVASALAGHPVLSLPIKTSDGRRITMTLGYPEAAIRDIWKAIGAGLTIVLPVRLYNSKQQNLFPEPLIDNTEEKYEPSLWNDTADCDPAVAKYYLQSLKQVHDYLSTEPFLSPEARIEKIPKEFEEAWEWGQNLTGVKNWSLYNPEDFRFNGTLGEYRKRYDSKHTDETKIELLKDIFVERLHGSYFKVDKRISDTEKTVLKKHNQYHSKQYTVGMITDFDSKTMSSETFIEILKAEHRAIVEGRRGAGVRNFFKSGGEDSEVAQALECCLKVAGVKFEIKFPGWFNETNPDIQNKKIVQTSEFEKWKQESAQRLLRYVDDTERSLGYKAANFFNMASDKRLYEDSIVWARKLAHQIIHCTEKDISQQQKIRQMILTLSTNPHTSSELKKIVNGIEYQLLGKFGRNKKVQPFRDKLAINADNIGSIRTRIGGAIHDYIERYSSSGFQFHKNSNSLRFHGEAGRNTALNMFRNFSDVMRVTDDALYKDLKDFLSGNDNETLKEYILNALGRKSNELDTLIGELNTFISKQCVI